MSGIHPRWPALLEWLCEKGMDTSAILVEARETPGKDQDRGRIVYKLTASRLRCRVWSFRFERDTSFYATVQNPCESNVKYPYARRIIPKGTAKADSGANNVFAPFNSPTHVLE